METRILDRHDFAKVDINKILNTQIERLNDDEFLGDDGDTVGHSYLKDEKMRTEAILSIVEMIEKCEEIANQNYDINLTSHDISLTSLGYGDLIDQIENLNKVVIGGSMAACELELRQSEDYCIHTAVERANTILKIVRMKIMVAENKLKAAA